jgi:hypothetical protein
MPYALDFTVNAPNFTPNFTPAISWLPNKLEKIQAVTGFASFLRKKNIKLCQWNHKRYFYILTRLSDLNISSSMPFNQPDISSSMTLMSLNISSSMTFNQPCLSQFEMVGMIIEMEMVGMIEGHSSRFWLFLSDTVLAEDLLACELRPLRRAQNSS